MKQAVKTIAKDAHGAILTNWAPTLFGLGLAIMEALNAVESGDPRDWAQAALFAALGYVTRQWNKSTGQSRI